MDICFYNEIFLKIEMNVIEQEVFVLVKLNIDIEKK